MYNDIIGIIGGMGSYATAFFFKEILDAFPAEKEWERPHIVIDNNCIMPSRVRAILYAENVDVLKKSLIESVERLEEYGKQGRIFVVLACNTSHYFLPLLKNVFQNVVFINIIESCARKIPNDVKEVLVLASEGTIATKLYDEYFDRYNIKVKYPLEYMEDIRYYIELVKQNKVNCDSAKKFMKFIDSFEYDHIILGCTELPVIFSAACKYSVCTKTIYNPLITAIEDIKQRIQ